MKLVVVVSVLLAAAQAATLGGRGQCRDSSDWCRSVHTAIACNAFPHCLHTVWKPLKVPVRPTKLCRQSQKLVKTVRHVLSMGKEDGDTAHLIASMCSSVREDALRKECKNMVADFLPQISKLMESGVEPATVAALMGLCKPYDSNESSPKAKAAHVIGQNDQDHSGRPEEAEEKEGGNILECELCKLVVGELDRLLSENKTETEIEYELDKICRRLAAYVDECESFVGQVVPMVIQMLVKDMDPHQVCLVLTLCTSSAAGELGVVTSGAGPQCTVCELIAGELEQLLTANTTEMAIKEALDRFCSLLPSSLSAECERVVNMYTPAIISLLVQEVPPHQICLMLGLCSSSSSSSHTAGSALLFASGEAAQVKKTEVGEGVMCELCKLAVNTVDQLLSENKTEAAIQQALDDVCHKLPSAITAQCLSFVDEYAAHVINLLIKELLDPRAVCLFLKLCPSSAAEFNIQVAQTERASADPAVCELCKAIITEINKLITDNRTEEAIIHVVEKVCDVVQGDLRLQCQSEVENYGPALLDLLRHMDDPTQVCTYLHLCAPALSVHPPPRNQPHMLGSEECTRGPAFWCASLENARKCGMEQECMKKYGMTP